MESIFQQQNENLKREMKSSTKKDLSHTQRAVFGPVQVSFQEMGTFSVWLLKGDFKEFAVFFFCMCMMVSLCVCDVHTCMCVCRCVSAPACIRR